MADRPDDVTLTFGGNATTLLRLGGFTVLTDPNFLRRGQRAYLGKGLWTKRLTDPALLPTQLPRLDAILLSHLHADHWDRIATRTLDRGTPVLTTQQAAAALGRRGFRETVDLRPWQRHELTRDGETLRITSVPGVHGPGPLARVLPPVMGSVLELVRGGEVGWRGYISGDTLFRPFLGEVLERCGPLDVVVPHLGGTKALGVTVTMDGRQGADLVELLKPPVTVPVHYDDYDRFRSPLGDFVREVAARRAPGEIRPVVRGETISLRPWPRRFRGLRVPVADRSGVPPDAAAQPLRREGRVESVDEPLTWGHVPRKRRRSGRLRTSVRAVRAAWTAGCRPRSTRSPPTTCSARPTPTCSTAPVPW